MFVKNLITNLNLKLRTIFLTLFVAIPTIILVPLILPPSKSLPFPEKGQLPFFVALTVFEALLFGLGISFIVFGRKHVLNLHASKRLSVATFVSISWLLTSWWIHDSLHLFNGVNLWGHLIIDYSFHIPTIIASLVIAYAYIDKLRHFSPIPPSTQTNN